VEVEGIMEMRTKRVGQQVLNFTHMKSTLQKRIKEWQGIAEEIS
jgi:hypothetical protein